VTRVEEDIANSLDTHPELRPIGSGHEVRCWRYHALDGRLLQRPAGDRRPAWAPDPSSVSADAAASPDASGTPAEPATPGSPVEAAPA
jgi:hypothetical protein